MAEAFDHIDAVYQRIGRGLFDSDKLREDLAHRDCGEAVFFTLVLVGAEIDNGGFSQFFTNSTGDLIEEATAGAEEFGLTEHAPLLREASDMLFPGGVPLEHEARLRAWDEMADEDGDAQKAACVRKGTSPLVTAIAPIPPS